TFHVGGIARGARRKELFRTSPSRRSPMAGARGGAGCAGGAPMAGRAAPRGRGDLRAGPPPSQRQFRALSRVASAGTVLRQRTPETGIPRQVLRRQHL